ncbi:MAG: NAD(P)/FAD-dependent oxidoreductase [Promethearchaeota archaeon]
MVEVNCEILVVGGGVAGLAAALAAARNGSDIILIEKESEIGFKIRGEVIKKEAPIFTKIFGAGLPHYAIVNNILERRLYSPSTLKFIDGKHTEPTVTIDYRLFILEIFKEVSKTNCKIFLNTELLDVIKEDRTVIGAICRKDREEIKIFAKYFIGAGGVHSKFANLLKKYSEREIYPILKFNYENLQIPNPHRIELYLITNPPGAFWMFPKSDTSGECGILVWTHDLPKGFDILQLWEKKSKENRVIREIIKNAKPYYISRDFINFGGPLKQIFGDGFVVVGDSGGHIGAIGGSGIISSMTVVNPVSS